MENGKALLDSTSMVVVVIPCLNEQEDLAATCHSLGFGVRNDHHALLVLVDNGSTDGTSEVACEVQQSARANSVFLVDEPELGFVPARAKGVQVASEIAKERGVSDERVLIVQADADTRYDDRYVELMMVEAASQGRGFLFEGISEWPMDFAKEHQEFIEFLRLVDIPSGIDDSRECDVIVDDKCCGYWLSDYVAWGGHRREYTRSGEEIYAETTRLFMRAIAHGARRCQVSGATARHSVRRWMERPLREFASAGFPRERSWYERWAAAERQVDGLPSSLQQPLTTPWDEALAERWRHNTALFEILPRLVADACTQPAAECRDEPDFGLTPRTRIELVNSPGALIEYAFSVIGKLDSTPN